MKVRCFTKKDVIAVHPFSAISPLSISPLHNHWIYFLSFPLFHFRNAPLSVPKILKVFLIQQKGESKSNTVHPVSEPYMTFVSFICKCDSGELFHTLQGVSETITKSPSWFQYENIPTEQKSTRCCFEYGASCRPCQFQPEMTSKCTRIMYDSFVGFFCFFSLLCCQVSIMLVKFEWLRWKVLIIWDNTCVRVCGGVCGCACPLNTEIITISHSWKPKTNH